MDSLESKTNEAQRCMLHTQRTQTNKRNLKMKKDEKTTTNKTGTEV